jgi:hypothetical protein
MTALHVCIVAPTANSILPGSTAKKAGGAEMQLNHLGKGLVQRGARVSFIVEDVGQRDVELVDGMEVVRCPFRYYGQSWRHYATDTCRLIALVRRLTPDVLLFKTPRTLALSLSTVRVCLATKVVRLMASDSDCDLQFWPPPNMLYLLGSQMVHGTVFQSDSQAALARRSLGLQGRVIPNIAHGMPLPAGSDHSLALQAHRRDIDCLWVGTCNANKAPLDFLEVVRACPEARCEMIMAPGSDKALQREVSSQASSLGNLDYRGFVPYRDIGGFYRRSRLVVHTSHREGFPNVFLQAWECGSPVVSIRVDPDGVITRHGLGRVSGSVAGAVADVRELLADESRRAAIGDACLEYLIRTHSPDAVIDQYLDYFKELGVRGASVA